MNGQTSGGTNLPTGDSVAQVTSKTKFTLTTAATSGPYSMIYVGGDGGASFMDGGTGGSGAAPVCFYRATAPSAIHLKWYGVTRGADSYNQLNNAMAAALGSYGNGCVDLDGLRVSVGSPTNQFGVIQVPSDVVIGCDDAPIGGVFTNTSGYPDFTLMPNALVLYEAAASFTEFPYVQVNVVGGISKDQTGPVDITTWGGQTITNCSNSPPFAYAQIDNEILEFNCVTNGGTSMNLVSRGVLGTQSSTHTQYAVIRDVPNNWTIQLSGNDGIENVNILASWLPSFTTEDNISLTNWRNEVNDLYFGEALQCVGDGCHIENMNILGFDTGFEAINAPRLYLRNITVDANNCYWIHSTADENQGGDTRCFPLLFNGAGDANLQWTIQGIAADSSSQCQITSADDGTNVPVNGDTIWIANVPSPQSCNGRWTIANLGQTTIGGTNYWQYSLADSSFSGAGSVTASWNAGSPMMTVSSLSNIYGLQNINGATYPGSFLCATGDSGTPPFCTPPQAFSLTTGPYTLQQNIHSGGNIQDVLVSSTTNWPSPGVIGITTGTTTEDVLYTVVDAQHINFTGRGAYGTGVVSHSIGDPITVGAPSVVSVWPKANNNTGSNIAILSVSCSYPAVGTCGLSGQPIYLLNVPSNYEYPTCNGGGDNVDPCADIYVSERYWTYNQAAGPWNLMNFDDDIDVYVPQCTQPNFNGTTISYGNCPGTGFLIGGPNPANDNNSGTNLTGLFSYGHQNQFHIWNSNSTAFYDAGS
ncbi:MAG TPA: hypothetical protein VMF67_12930, partial [Rhizomicrobium sp.]|nr:hypothetical protein [Rhizomicrobium sp.]